MPTVGRPDILFIKKLTTVNNVYCLLLPAHTSSPQTDCSVHPRAVWSGEKPEAWPRCQISGVSGVQSVIMLVLSPHTPPRRHCLVAFKILKILL